MFSCLAVPLFGTKQKKTDWYHIQNRGGWLNGGAILGFSNPSEEAMESEIQWWLLTSKCDKPGGECVHPRVWYITNHFQTVKKWIWSCNGAVNMCGSILFQMKMYNQSTSIKSYRLLVAVLGAFAGFWGFFVSSASLLTVCTAFLHQKRSL